MRRFNIPAEPPAGRRDGTTMSRTARQWARPNQRTIRAETPDSVVRLIGRLFFGTGAAVGLVSALIAALLPPSIDAAARLGLLVCYLGFALVCGFAHRRSAPTAAARCRTRPCSSRPGC